jgi:hypothetical protein
MFEEPCGITTQRTTSCEVAMLRPKLGSREVTPSSDKEASSDVAAHCAQEGIKGSKKRHKQCLQGTTTTTSHDDGHDWEVRGSGMRHISTVVHSDKRPTRPPMDHFKRLLEDACPNHIYPVRHRLKDYGMMRSFMTSWSLTWGAKLDEGPDRSNTPPLPEENAVMTVTSSPA